MDVKFSTFARKKMAFLPLLSIGLTGVKFLLFKEKSHVQK
jgi:hypothetical protein